MVRPKGFDHFCSHLKGFENFYCVIGGGAAALLMEDEGLEFRATKDIDLVVLIRSSELNVRILTYIREGGYKIKEATAGLPRYYRFKNPEKGECPAIIEIFARNELGLELEEGQRIIPISDDPAEKLSAILLDDEYFELIKNNLFVSDSGIPVINALANICLKAGAHRDLSERRHAGDRTVEEKAIQKHLKDIWRLAAILTGDESIALTGIPLKDIELAIRKLEEMPERQFAQVMEKVPAANMTDVMSVLRKVFLNT